MRLKIRRGQIRILETIVACGLILMTYLFVQRTNTSITIESKSDLKNTANNLLNTLENQELLVGIIDEDSNWQTQLNGIIRASLPPNTYYNITFTSLLTGDNIGSPISNYDAFLLGEYNTVSVNGVYSLSYPVLQETNTPIDVMLVIDRSGSMADRIPGDTNNKLYYAKLAAQNFISKLDSATDTVGLASFATTSTLNSGLTDSFSTVNSRINGLSASGSTNLMGGINKANVEYSDHLNSSRAQVMIILTDGVANYWDNYSGPQNEYWGCRKAEEKAAETDASIKVFTIGLGSTSYLNQTLLQNIQTDGYYYSPSAQDLDNIYQSIADRILSSVSYDVILVQITLKEPLGV
jgi:hypothetical protein